MQFNKEPESEEAIYHRSTNVIKSIPLKLSELLSKMLLKFFRFVSFLIPFAFSLVKNSIVSCKLLFLWEWTKKLHFDAQLCEYKMIKMYRKCSRVIHKKFMLHPLVMKFKEETQILQNIEFLFHKITILMLIYFYKFVSKWNLFQNYSQKKFKPFLQIQTQFEI